MSSTWHWVSSLWGTSWYGFAYAIHALSHLGVTAVHISSSRGINDKGTSSLSAQQHRCDFEAPPEWIATCAVLGCQSTTRLQVAC